MDEMSSRLEDAVCMLKEKLTHVLSAYGPEFHNKAKKLKELIADFEKLRACDSCSIIYTETDPAMECPRCFVEIQQKYAEQRAEAAEASLVAVEAETMAVAKVGVLNDDTKGITWLNNRHLKEGDKLYAKRAPAATQPQYLVRRGLQPDGTYPQSDDDETAATQVGGTDSLVHTANGPAPAAAHDEIARRWAQ